MPSRFTWCPECGPDVAVDEDGCCTTCGNGATGPGADAAHEACIIPPGECKGLTETSRDCYDCGAQGSCTRTVETEFFYYRDTVLTAQVPVWTCGLCGDASTGGEAAAIRMEAVAAHLQDKASEMQTNEVE
jgi:hypothetical protein